MPYIDNDDISRRHKERIRRLEEDKKTGLTMAQRLTLRSLKRTFTVEIPPATPEEEPIKLLFHVPAGDEWDHMVKLLQESQKIKPDTVKGQKRLEEIMDELYTTLADLAIDESLTKEFWKDPANGGADETLAIQVLTEMFTALNRMRGEGGSFRRNTDGSRVD